LRHTDAAIRTGEALGVKGFVSVDDGDEDEPAAEFHRECDRLLEAVFDSGFHQQAIDNDFDGVVLTLVEARSSSRFTSSPSTRAREKPCWTSFSSLF